jgi:anti-anti-sigma factor
MPYVATKLCAMLIVVTEALDGLAVQRWSRLLDDAVARRPNRLTVDLSRSPRIDAAAIEMLLRLHRAMLTSGGRLTLRGPGDRVRRTLALARVEQVLDVEDLLPVEAR